MNKFSRPRKRAATVATLLAAAILNGCASWPVAKAPDLIGAQPQVVEARLGPPREIRQLGNGEVRWFYPTQPFGQYTWRADFDARGMLFAYRQVLSSEEFAKARVDVWSKEDVLNAYGNPLPEKQYFSLSRREAWSYRYKQDGVWPALMHFLFDDAGVLRNMQVENPDPLYDPDRRRWMRF